MILVSSVYYIVYIMLARFQQKWRCMLVWLLSRRYFVVESFECLFRIMYTIGTMWAPTSCVANNVTPRQYQSLSIPRTLQPELLHSKQQYSKFKPHQYYSTIQQGSVRAVWILYLLESNTVQCHVITTCQCYEIQLRYQLILTTKSGHTICVVLQLLNLSVLQSQYTFCCLCYYLQSSYVLKLYMYIIICYKL